MFSKILVALDLSAEAQRVFEKGLSLAQRYQGALFLLHVLSAEEDASPMPIPLDLGELYPATGNELTMELWQEQWQNFEQQGLDLLRGWVEQANQAGVTADFQQILGSPGKTICEQAKELGANLIVVGHRGRWGLSEILLGSVSNYVFHHAPCCVLVVPTPEA